MHAKRQAFITRSDVFRLKEKPSFDTNTPPQVNKGRGRGVRRRGNGKEKRCAVDRCFSHTHTSGSSVGEKKKKKKAHGQTVARTVN